VAPEVSGFTNGVNQMIADTFKEDRNGCLVWQACIRGNTTNVLADMEQIAAGNPHDQNHPPHQLLYPNDYPTEFGRNGKSLTAPAEANGVP